MPRKPKPASKPRLARVRRSALLDTRIIHCGPRLAGLDQHHRLADACIDPIYIDPRFNSYRNYDFFWGDSSEPRPLGSSRLSTMDAVWHSFGYNRLNTNEARP